MTDQPDFRALCADLVDELHGYKVAIPNHDRSLVARARAALSTLPLAPIPVSERLPGAEDLDSEGCCWWIAHGLPGDPVWRSFTPSELADYKPHHEDKPTHWLPHWAIPLPQDYQ